MKENEQMNTEENIDLIDSIKGMIATLEIDDSMKDSMNRMLNHFSEGGTLADLHDLTAKDLEVIYSMGLNFYNSAKYEDAKTIFKFLCMMDHTGNKWWMGLGAAKQMLKDFEGAVNAYGYCTLLDVEDPRPQLQAGYCLLALGKKEEAVSALEGAIMAAGDEDRYAGSKKQAEALLNSIGLVAPQ